MRVHGLLSGTSADAIDAALVEVGWDDDNLTFYTHRTTSTHLTIEARSKTIAAVEPATAAVRRISRLSQSRAYGVRRCPITDSPRWPHGMPGVRSSGSNAATPTSRSGSSTPTAPRTMRSGR